jgi:hypothetical protein
LRRGKSPPPRLNEFLQSVVLDPECSAEISCSRFIVKSPFVVKWMRVTVSATPPNLPQLAKLLRYFPLKRASALEGQAAVVASEQSVHRSTIRWQ